MRRIKKLPSSLIISSFLSLFSAVAYASGDDISGGDQNMELEQAESELDWDELTMEEQEDYKEFLRQQLMESESLNEEVVLKGLFGAIEEGRDDDARRILNEDLPYLSRNAFVKAYNRVVTWGDKESIEFLTDGVTPGIYQSLSEESAPWARHKLVAEFAKKMKLTSPDALLMIHSELDRILKDRRLTIEAIMKVLKSDVDFEKAQLPLLVALDRGKYCGPSVLAMLIDGIRIQDGTAKLNRQIKVLTLLEQAGLLSERLVQELIKKNHLLAGVIEFAQNASASGMETEPDMSQLSLLIETESGGQMMLPLSIFKDGIEVWQQKIEKSLESKESFQEGILEAVRSKDHPAFGILLSKGKDFLDSELIFAIFNTAAESDNQMVVEMLSAGLMDYEHMDRVSFKTKSYLLSKKHAESAGSNFGWHYWSNLPPSEQKKPENSPAYFQLIATEVFRVFLADENSFPYTKKGLDQLVSHLKKKPSQFVGRDGEGLLSLQQNFSFANLLRACVHWKNNLIFPPDIRTALR